MAQLFQTLRKVLNFKHLICPIEVSGIFLYAQRCAFA